MPNEPALAVPTVDRSPVAPITARPEVPRRTMLRPRALNGLGRPLRGTRHAVFIVY